MGLADIDILLKRLPVFNAQVEISDGCCLEANQSGFDMGFLSAVSDPRDVQISSWVCYINYKILSKERRDRERRRKKGEKKRKKEKWSDSSLSH